jgi:4-amino-4-deoxychorismate lyase
MSQFLESIKIVDGVPQNLNYHQNRLDKTLKDNYINFQSIKLDETIKIPQNICKGLFKCRVFYDHKKVNISFTPYEFSKIETLKIVDGLNIVYDYKFTNRDSINELFKQKGTCDDILIVKDGLVTDTSFANIAFFDGMNWLTPEKPLLQGTCRERLISEHQIFPKMITVDKIFEYKYFTIFNAMRGDKLKEYYSVRNIIE